MGHWAILAGGYRAEGKYAEVLECLHQAEKLDPNHAELSMMSAAVYAELGEYQQVIKYASKAIELNIDQPAYAYLLLSMSYQELGQMQQATQYFEKAMGLDPDLVKEAGLLDGAIVQSREGKPTGVIEDGIYREYYDNGLIKLEGRVSSDTLALDGIVKAYSESGKLLQEEHYANGQREGISKIYYESGQLRIESYFENDKQNGLDRRYYENGQLQQEVNYSDDKPVGIGKAYDENGVLREEMPHRDGKIHGIVKFYDENGNLEEKVHYNNGKPVDGRIGAGIMKGLSELIF